MKNGPEQFRYRVATPFGTFQRITSAPVAYVVVYEEQRAGRRMGFALGWVCTLDEAERLATELRSQSRFEPMIVSVTERRRWAKRRRGDREE